jgi:N-methylhydantoinase B
VFGCLNQGIPSRVPAEGASCLWTAQLRGMPQAADGDAGGFDAVFFNSGGTGARPHKDGLSATAFPSGVRAMPVEVTESKAPIVIWRKELRPDSGGAGRFRGGLGQVVEVGARAQRPMHVLALYDRVAHPARGREGGGAGAPGRVSLASGKVLAAKGLQLIPAGDRLRLELPGGGGYGDPAERSAEHYARDQRDGLVTLGSTAPDKR